MLLGGLRRHHPYSASSAEIARQWAEFEALGRIPGQLGGTTYGVICGHDADGFEYMCGVEVESLASLPAGLGRMRVLAQRYAVFVHRGPVLEIRGTWQRILDAWLPVSGYESAQRPDFEIYAADFDPSAGRGAVEIWIAIMPAGSSEGRRPS
jgi:predicted transcriptional regulator YdeE